MSEFNPFSLAGKRILVTGASSGLGRASAVSFARMGAEVIATGRDAERLAEVAAALAQASPAAHRTLRADLTDAAEREALVDALGGPIHGVLHSAGISRLSPIRMVTVELLREIQAANVEAPVLLSQSLLKRGLVAPGGSILFIASIAAYIGTAGGGPYASTKAALVALSRSLATELARRKIRVNCLAPALVESPMLTATADYMVKSLEDEQKAYPLGFGKPEDVANAATFFLSDASRWVTGTTLVMDGGLTLT